MTWGDFAKESSENSSSMVYGSWFAIGLFRNLITRGICQRGNHPQNFVMRAIWILELPISREPYEELWGMFVGQPFRDQSHIQIALIATIGSDMAGFDYTFWHLLALTHVWGKLLSSAPHWCGYIPWLVHLPQIFGEIKLPTLHQGRVDSRSIQVMEVQWLS